MAPSLAPILSLTKIDMCSELVGMAGFEPAASCSQSRRANQAAPHPAEPYVAYRPAGHGPVPCDRGRAARLFPAVVGSAPGPSSGYAVGAHLARRSGRQARGRSSMAEPQPSKLVMRVRFPSPALTVPPQVKGMIIGF